jgi:hypothetical protein
LRNIKEMRSIETVLAVQIADQALASQCTACDRNTVTRISYNYSYALFGG